MNPKEKHKKHKRKSIKQENINKSIKGEVADERFVKNFM